MTSINPYLVDAAEIVISKRTVPISVARSINYGSMAIDDGHLILSPDERDELLVEAPQAERYVRPLMGADEFLNDTRRYCLWLADAPAAEAG